MPLHRFRASLDLRLHEDALVVGMVGNLNPKKGVEYFIRAASVIYCLQPNSWFVVVGTRHTATT
jgi:glycosyltransferase involved in cell wall biosynthesis